MKIKNITIDADDISDEDTDNKFVTAIEKEYWNDKVDKTYSSDYAYTDGLVFTFDTDHYIVGDGTATYGNGTSTEVIIPKYYDDGTGLD